MRLLSQQIFLSIMLGFFIPSFSSGLSFHNPWTHAKVLNAGQSYWSFDTTYESSRKVTDTPNTKVTNTWAQLLKNSKSAQATADLETQRTATGQSLNDQAATTEYELYQETMTMNIDWSYGIYKKWMIGFDVPLVATKQNIRAQSQGPQNADVTATAQQELKDVGVKADRTQYTEQRLGDVALLSQVQLATYYSWVFAFQQKLGVPTATQPDDRNLFMSRAGNSQPNLGGRLLASHYYRAWQLHASAGYLWQPKDQIRVRLPEANGDVSGDIETGVTRDLGDMYDAQVESVWRQGVFDWITGYRVTHKQADRYQGTFVDQSRYDELSSNSEWTRHLISVGALYRIGTQRAGVQDGYSVLVAGHWPLQQTSPLWSLDLRMMF